MEKIIYQDSFICIVEDTYEIDGGLSYGLSSCPGGVGRSIVSKGMIRYWLYNSDRTVQYFHSDFYKKYGYKSIHKPVEGIIRLEFTDGEWFYFDLFGKPLNKLPFKNATDFRNGFGCIDAATGFDGSLVDHFGNIFLKSRGGILIKLPEGYRTGFFIDDNTVALQKEGSQYYFLFDKSLNPYILHEWNGDLHINFKDFEKGPLDWCVYLIDNSHYANHNVRCKKSLFNLHTKQFCYDGPSNYDSSYKVISSFVAIGEECVHSTEGTLCFKNGKRLCDIISIDPQYDRQIIIICKNANEKSNYGCISFSGETIVPTAYSDLHQIGDYIEAELDGSKYLYNYDGSIVYDNVVLPKGIHAFSELGSGKLLVKTYSGGWQNNFDYGVFDINAMCYLLPMEYSSIVNYSEKTIIVCKDDKYGLVDQEYNFLLECKYKSLKYISDDLIICSAQENFDTNYGIINRDGSFVIPASYGNIDWNGCDRIVFKTHYGSREFYTDLNFNTAVKLTDDKELVMKGFWNLLGNFSDGICIYETEDKKYGIVNEQSNTVVSAKYDSINTSDIPGVFFGKIGETHFLLNPQCAIEKQIACNHIWTKTGEKYANYIFVSKNKKMGLLDSRGEIILDCDYSSISVYDDYLMLERDDQVGKADLDGNIIIPCEYKSFEVIDKGYYIAFKSYACLLSPYGSPVIDENKQYKSIIKTKADCLITVTVESDGERHYGLISKKGRIIIEPGLSHIGEFVNGIAIVNQGGSKKPVYNMSKGKKELTLEGGKFGLINENGCIVANPEYDYIGKDSDGYRVVVKKRGQEILFGIINSEGDVVLKCNYKYVRNVTENLIVFAEGGEWSHDGWANEKLIVSKFNDGMCFLKGARWGILDLLGNIIIEPFADYMRIISEGKVTYKLGGKYGVIELPTRERQMTDYEYLSAFHEGRCIAGKLDSQNHLRYGYIKEDYTELVPCEYTKAYHYRDGEGCLEKGRYKYYFNLDGELIRDESDYDSYDPNDDYDWERETWYALTGGQYGDYPGPGVDYDFLGL